MKSRVQRGVFYSSLTSMNTPGFVFYASNQISTKKDNFDGDQPNVLRFTLKYSNVQSVDHVQIENQISFSF